MPMKKVGVLPFCLLWAGLLALAQDGARCVLPVNVVDVDTQFVTEIGNESLAIWVGNVFVKPLSVVKQAPRNVILLLDSSRQLRGGPTQRNRQLLLLYWLAASAPNDVSLLAYTGKIEAVLRGKKNVLAELKSRGAKPEFLGGESDIMATLLHTATAMEAEPGDVIFVIGPAVLPISGSDRKRLLRILQRRGIRLFYMQFLRYQDLMPLLHTEAKLSGGSGFVWPEEPRARSTNEIEELRERLVNQMYRFYRVEFDWPAGPSANSPIEIHVRDSQRETKLLYPAAPVCAVPGDNER